MLDKDKLNIIVTGATGGIGNSIVENICEAGANVLVAGSYIFKGKNLSDYKNNISLLRNSF